MGSPASLRQAPFRPSEASCGSVRVLRCPSHYRAFNQAVLFGCLQDEGVPPAPEGQGLAARISSSALAAGRHPLIRFDPRHPPQTVCILPAKAAVAIFLPIFSTDRRAVGPPSRSAPAPPPVEAVDPPAPGSGFRRRERDSKIRLAA